MSDRREGRQGRQGVRGFEGPQGVQGMPGEGERGHRGAPGARGVTGSPSRGFTAFFVVVVVMVTILAWAAAQHAARVTVRHDSLRQEQTERRVFTEICLRNNIVKATTRTNLRRGLPSGVGSPENIRRNDLLNPILDCVATFRGSPGHPVGVRLPGPVEQEYLRIIDQGRIPDLKGPRIVGKHLAESAGHADF